MKKPDGYDNAQAMTGEFEKIVPGGYICIIKQAKMDKTSTGKDALVLLFDIYEGEHKDYFKRDFDHWKESNPDAKWHGVFRQITDGNSLPFFKGMITAIEQSNNGYKWAWDEATLKGKLFGGVFGEEEYKGRPLVKCQSIRSVEAIRSGKFTIPEKKLLSGSTAHKSAAGQAPDSGFAPMDDDDGLPF